MRGNGRHCPSRDRRSGSGSGRDRGDRGGGGGCRGQRGRRGGREGDGDALQEARRQLALLDVLDAVLQALDVAHLENKELISRADKKSQVRQCLGFCSAFVYDNQKLDVQKPQHCLT